MSTNGVDLEYEIIGGEHATPIVLVTGFSQQLIRWDDAFCLQVAERGFKVIRFDNRDVGLSTKLDSSPRPNLPAILGGDTAAVAENARRAPLE